MAHISINPDRRDPGFFKKKSEVGLPNVDNMSAAEFVGAVSEDMKILNNKKKRSEKIQKKGEYFGGIIKSADKSTHASFTLGLFNSSSKERELASVHVDFAFSCTSPDEYGNLTYTICCPDQDPYLKNLYLIFSQVQENLYITLHSPLFPDESSSEYFNILGLDLEEWTEGVTKLPLGKDISEIVKSHEIARVKLTGACTTIGSGSSDGLSVYDSAGRRVTDNSFQSLDGYDYPSINGVPFIGRRGFTVKNKEAGRHITVPAYHKDGSLSGAGEHLWEVLGDLRKINISRSSTKATPKKTSVIPNSDALGYGLVRPSKYNILPSEQPNNEVALSWLESLGDETDVITVGAFKEILSYLLGLNSSANTYNLYLIDSEDSYKYVSFSNSQIVIPVHSSLKAMGGTNGGLTSKEITATSSETWVNVSVSEDESSECTWNINLSVTNNSSGQSRTATITITQEESGRSIDLTIFQSSFSVTYGVLYKNQPVYDGSEITLNRWENTSYTGAYTIIPIKSSLTDPKGYTVISNPEVFSFTSGSNWISGSLSGNNLILSAEANSTSSVRTGIVYIGVLENSGGNVVYIPVHCSQSAATSRLSINGDSNTGIISHSVGKNSTFLTFSVYSNYAWSVSEDSVPGWITLTGYSGERNPGTSNLTLTISENDSQSIRTANIKIVNKGGSQRIIQVTQSSREVYIDINNQSQDQFFSFREDFYLTVNSNVNWFIDQCPKWLIPSVYNGGVQGTAKDVKVTFTKDDSVTLQRGETGVVSFSYYDEDSDTIFALRKITVCPEILIFSNGDLWVYPQGTPQAIKVPASGESVTIKAKASCNYKMLFGEYIPGSTKPTQYEQMISGYSKDVSIISEEWEDDAEFTSLTFEVAKNSGSSGRTFTFSLIPEEVDYMTSDDMIELPVFTVYQEGNKSITPVILDESTLVSTSKENLGFWVYSYSGETVNTKPTNSGRNPRLYVDPVYECFHATKGQIILLPQTANLYKSSKETPEVGDTLKRIWGVNSGNEEYESCYLVEETGYYFATNGEADVVSPKTSGISIGSGRTEFELTLLSVSMISWDFYGDAIPGWISLERISGNAGLDKIKVIVDENPEITDRSTVLQFYVDSIGTTVGSFSISQSGVNVSFGTTTYLGITPVVSSSGTAFSSDEFEIRLSALANYSGKIIVNGEENPYTYSEYQDSGVVFSLPEDCTWAEITLDSFGKPKLHVSENTGTDPRSLLITATYDDKSGDLVILQGSSDIIQFYTYSNLEITPNYENIPYGASKIGFKVIGDITLNHIVTETGEVVTGSTSEGIEIKFPVMHDDLQISDCGLILKTPDTLEYIGELTDDVVITYPYTKFEKVGDVVKSVKETISTSPVTLEKPQEPGRINIESTLLSGQGPNKSLVASWTKTNLGAVKIYTTTYESGVHSYMNYQEMNGSTITNPSPIEVVLLKKPTEYYKDKTVTYYLTKSTGEILKYIHFRNNRSIPQINSELTESTSLGTQSTAKIQVNSNIGYTSTPWSNNPDGVYIKGGNIQTFETNLEDTRIIEYSSSNQPSKKWWKKYSTESVIIQDTDYYGITIEVPIILPVGYATPGFTLIRNGETIGGNSFDLYLPYNSSSEKIYIQSHDSCNIQFSSADTGVITRPGDSSDIIDGEITKPGDGSMITPTGSLVVVDARTWIEKKVGSLSNMSFVIECPLSNSGYNDVFRGTVTISSSTRSFTFNVYQKSRGGVATITSPENKVFVIGETKSITFEHSYPGWQIVSMDQVSSSRNCPTFNGQAYNSSYGFGGNYGNDWGDSLEKTSTVTLDYSRVSVSENNSLELVGNFPTTSGIPFTPESYGIKSATVDLLQTSADNVDVTDTFEIKIRPKRPEFSVYQEKGQGTLVKAQDSLDIELVKKNTSLGSGNELGGTISAVEGYFVDFYIASDIFSRVSPYIGGTLTMNGEEVTIYDQTTLYGDLITPINIEYTTRTKLIGNLGEEPTYGDPVTEIITAYEPDSFDDFEGETYAHYRVKIANAPQTGGGMIVIDNVERSGKVTIKMNDFVVDPAYYQGGDPTVQELTLNFN